MYQFLEKAEYIKTMAQALSCNIYACNSQKLSKAYEEAATELLAAAKESIQLYRNDLQSNLSKVGIQKENSIN